MIVTRLRRLYGAGTLHLLVLVASFAIAGFAVAGWFDRSFDLGAVLLWFGAAILGHDLVLLPLYSLIDWIAFGRGGPSRAHAGEHANGGVSATVYLRVPVLLSGLLLLVFFPLVFQLGSGPYRAASGLGQGVYLARWLGATGAIFAAAAVAYALAVRRGRGPRGGRRALRRSDGGGG